MHISRRLLTVVALSSLLLVPLAAGAQPVRAGDPQQLNEPSTFRQVAPAVAPLAGGGFVAVWEDQREGIVARFVDADGAGVGSSVVLAANSDFPEVAGTYGYTSQRQPAVVALPAGGFLVAWVQQDAILDYSYFRTDTTLISQSVQARAFNGAGAPVGEAFRMAPGNRQTHPSLAVLAGGELLVTWQQRSTRTKAAAVVARRADALEGAFGRPIPVSRVASIAARPVVTALADGGFLVAWTGVDADGAGVEVRRFDSQGVAAGAAVGVNTTTVGGQGGVSLAPAGDGFLVAWQHEVEAGLVYRIRGRFLGADGQPAGGELALTGETAEADGAAVLAPLADGGFQLYWLGWSERFPAWILGRSFDAAGAPVGEVVQVSTRRPQSQATLGVAVGDGSVLVAWEGFEGAGRGISARAFATSGD